MGVFPMGLPWRCAADAPPARKSIAAASGSIVLELTITAPGTGQKSLSRQASPLL